MKDIRTKQLGFLECTMAQQASSVLVNVILKTFDNQIVQGSRIQLFEPVLDEQSFLLVEFYEIV